MSQETPSLRSVNFVLLLESTADLHHFSILRGSLKNPKGSKISDHFLTSMNLIFPSFSMLSKLPNKDV